MVAILSERQPGRLSALRQNSYSFLLPGWDYLQTADAAVVSANWTGRFHSYWNILAGLG